MGTTIYNPTPACSTTCVSIISPFQMHFLPHTDDDDVQSVEAKPTYVTFPHTHGRESRYNDMLLVCVCVKHLHVLHQPE